MTPPSHISGHEPAAYFQILVQRNIVALLCVLGYWKCGRSEATDGFAKIAAEFVPTGPELAKGYVQNLHIFNNGK